MAASRYRDITASIRTDWQFYRRRTQWLGKLLLAQTFIIACCAGAITYLGMKQVVWDQGLMRVYGTDTQGYLYSINPTRGDKGRVFPHDAVQKWIEGKLGGLFTFSPQTYGKVVSDNLRFMYDAKPDKDPKTGADIEDAASDYKAAVAELKKRFLDDGQSVKAELSGKLQMSESAVVDGRYTWYFRQPMTIRTTAGLQIPVSLLVQVSQFGTQPGISALQLEAR